jgi:hypothetical protein
MSQEDPQQLQAAIRQILRLAAIDQDFRKLALRDSPAAFARFNFTLPEGIAVEFVENYGKSRKYVVLPDPVVDIEELTDEDLEDVAGGCTLASEIP